MRASCSVSYVRLLEAGFTPADSDVLPRIDQVLNERSPDRQSRGSAKSTDTTGLDEAYT